jgi:starvation-inducible DNA-binding protein
LNLEKKETRKIKVNTGLEANDRERITKGLSKLLADSYMLLLKTHLYHWNVKGKMFHTIHEMTEEQYNELFVAIDEIAERIRALGFDAPGTFTEFNKLTSIQEGNGKASQEEMIADLLKSHESISRLCYEVIPVGEKAGDEVTVDMLIERITVHEKTAWMWRSFLER